MIPAAGLDGFCPVELLQHHDPGQMVGEGHGAHGEPEIRLFLDSGGHAEGGADEKAGAALAGELYVSHFFGEGLTVCTLGKRILRCEMAPLCALSAVMYAAGEY